MGRAGGGGADPAGRAQGGEEGRDAAGPRGTPAGSLLAARAAQGARRAAAERAARELRKEGRTPRDLIPKTWTISQLRKRSTVRSSTASPRPWGWRIFRRAASRQASRSVPAGGTTEDPACPTMSSTGVQEGGRPDTGPRPARARGLQAPR